MKVPGRQSRWKATLRCLRQPGGNDDKQAETLHKVIYTLHSRGQCTERKLLRLPMNTVKLDTSLKAVNKGDSTPVVTFRGNVGTRSLRGPIMLAWDWRRFQLDSGSWSAKVLHHDCCQLQIRNSFSQQGRIYITVEEEHGERLFILFLCRCI